MGKLGDRFSRSFVVSAEFGVSCGGGDFVVNWQVAHFLPVACLLLASLGQPVGNLRLGTDCWKVEVSRFKLAFMDSPFARSLGLILGGSARTSPPQMLIAFRAKKRT